MHRVILPFVMVAAAGGYVLSQQGYLSPTALSVYKIGTAAPADAVNASSIATVPVALSPASSVADPAQLPAGGAAAAAAPVAQAGTYKDGSYRGSVADAYYGNVQVQANVQNGQLVSVKILQYPSDRNTSRYINSQALPMLRQEAIQAQTSQIDFISGATLTSNAFVQSLATALSQAQSGQTSQSGSTI